MMFRNPSPFLMACPGGLLLMTYALLNGLPFFYPDAFVYYHYGDSAWQKLAGVLPEAWVDAPPQGALQNPAGGVAAAVGPASGGMAGTDAPQGGDWTPRSGKSVYYGILSALPGLFSPPWNGVIIQAYCGALAAALAWRMVVGVIGLSYLVAMAVLGILSTFGIFASTAMPDVWAAIGVLAFAVLAAGQDRTRRVHRIALWGMVLFAALAHSSHLAVLASLAALCALFRLAGWTGISWSVIGRLVAVLVATVGLGAAERIAMERAAGNPPLGMAFLTAHLVDGGPGMDFIRDACPGSGFAVCERADQLPVEWRDFLFTISEPVDYAHRLADEDLSFALATLRHDPLPVVGLALRDALRQAGMIGLVSTPIRAGIPESVAAEGSDGVLARKVVAGRLYDAGWLYRSLSILNTGLVLAGLAVVGAAMARPDLGTETGRLRRLLILGVAGLLLNAAVCGILASPYDRFQARVAWLVPLLGMIVLAARRPGFRLNVRQKETGYP